MHDHPENESRGTGEKVRVLLVCMGNICRSPTAEGVLREQARQRGWEGHFLIDSAGTHDYHRGSPPDRRSQQAALLDWLLAMDADNLSILQQRCPEPALRSKLRLFLSFVEETRGAGEVPDPYYGGTEGFEQVLDLCERGAAAFLEKMSQGRWPAP